MTDSHDRLAQLSARRTNGAKKNPARGARRVAAGLSVALTVGLAGTMAAQANANSSQPPVVEQVIVVKAQQPGEPVILQVTRVPGPPKSQQRQSNPSTKTRGS